MKINFLSIVNCSKIHLGCHKKQCKTCMDKDLGQIVKKKNKLKKKKMKVMV